MWSHEHVERATHVIPMSCVVAISPNARVGVDKVSMLTRFLYILWACEARSLLVDSVVGLSSKFCFTAW